MPTYDVVISFAGKDREIAEAIISSLVMERVNVFYDEYEKENLWGNDFFVHLIKKYGSAQ